MSVTFSILVGILSVAVVFDLRWRRIPNALILGGLLLGLACGNAFGGLDGALDSGLGALLGLALFFPFFLLRWLGAGDVKLLAVVGAFVGFEGVPAVALFTVLTGVALALAANAMVRLGWLSGTMAESRAANGADARSLLALGRLFRSASYRLPYALAIAAGAVFWIVRQVN